MTIPDGFQLPPREPAEGPSWQDEDDHVIVRAFAPSNWDDRVLAHIDAHLDVESTAEQAYEALAEGTDFRIAYLAKLVASEERRHHQILEDIARSLRARTDDDGGRSPGSHQVVLSPEEREKLLAATRELIDLERRDTSDLRQLRRDLRLSPPETIWPLLVELMEDDTEKHLKILREIERRLRRQSA